MQRVLLIVGIMSFAAGMTGCGSYTSLRSPQKPAPENSAMTMEDVIALSKANTGDEVIIAQIQAKQAVFALSNQDIINLKNAGVSEPVIEAMIKTDAVAKKDSVVVHHSYPSNYWWGYAGYYWPRYYYGYPRSYWGASIYWRPYYGGIHGGARISSGPAATGRRSFRRR